MLSQKGELSKITEDVDNWMKMIRQLSHDTSCEKEVEQTLSIISKIDDDKIRIAFIGAPNSGKSSIINRLLERKIIPVTVLSSATEFEIRPTANEQIESFSFGGMSKPLKEFKETVSSLEEKSEFGSFVLTISSNWLNSKPFVLLEKTPLDPSNKNVEEVVDEYLRNLDVIILVVDALMPVKRAEAILLKECVKREIPVIVILSKIDKIPPDERDNVVTYVKKFVGSCSTDIPVLAIQANVENDTFGTDNLKVLIENLVERVDIQQIRNRQVANTLLKSIEVIRNTAQMSLEIQKKNEKEIRSEIEKLQLEIDTRKLIWWQIEQDLTKRRQNIERQLSKHLEANSDTILETLFSELEKSKDVKTWWNQDMPKLLQDELHSSVSQLSISINQSIVNDLKWLQEELEQKLNYSFEVYVEPGISVNENKPVQKDLLLSNNNQFKIITKIGTIAIAVTAGAMLITSTPIALATGAITGIVAEKLINSNIVKDKEKVRSELKVIISKTILEYTSTFSQKLRIKYDQINENLKTHSIIWQQTQLQALNAVEQRNQHGKEVDFNDILKKINTLSEDIRKHFYTYSISEL